MIVIAIVVKKMIAIKPITIIINPDYSEQRENENIYMY